MKGFDFKNINFYHPRTSKLLFITIFAILFFLYGFNDILFMQPQGVHQWRQCDCLAFTQTYFQDGNNFLEPKLLYLAADNTGKTASDFPLIYYSVAQIWKIFGKHEFIYRAIVLSLAFTGFFFLFLMTEDIFKDSFIALWVSFIMYSSPILVYYSNNFLTNVPAFSLALVALYFFYHFYKSHKNKYLYISMLFYTIAGLLKVPALTSFAAILGILVLESSNIIKTKKHIFFSLKKQIPAFFIVIIPVILWYNYAAWYNTEYNNHLFLIGILPIWDLNTEQVMHIVEYANLLWKDSYQSIFMQVTSAFMFGLILILRRKNSLYLWWFTVFLSIGFVAFIILWFQVFDNHDYYLINQLVFMIAILISFFYLIKKNYKKIYQNIFFRLLLIVVLVLNISHCKNIIDARYYGWQNAQHLKYTKVLESITPYLRNNLQISSEDTVIFMNDHSFNISLYLMEQKGYTNFDTELRDYTSISKKIEAGVKYIMLNDSSLLEKEYLKPFIQNKVGQYKNIQIFKVDKSFFIN